MNLEELIREARIRYPIGTRYNPVHLDDNENVICTIHTSNFLKVGYCIGIGSGNQSINGHGYSETVYSGSSQKWARIVSYPEDLQVQFEIY